MQKARFNLVRKAALGLLDVNGDALKRIERIFSFNLITDIPKLVAIKPLDDLRYDRFVDDTLEPLEFYEKLYNNI